MRQEAEKKYISFISLSKNMRNQIKTWRHTRQKKLYRQDFFKSFDRISDEKTQQLRRRQYELLRLELDQLVRKYGSDFLKEHYPFLTESQV